MYECVHVWEYQITQKRMLCVLLVFFLLLIFYGFAKIFARNNVVVVFSAFLLYDENCCILQYLEQF